MTTQATDKIMNYNYNIIILLSFSIFQKTICNVEEKVYSSPEKYTQKYFIKFKINQK